MKKKLPALKNDADAETFVAQADLTKHDLSGLTPMRFEMKKKDKAVNLRMPQHLFEAVRLRAKAVGIPYQRFIRMALEKAVQGSREV